MPPKISATFNVFHPEPDEASPQAYRVDLCAATNRAISPNDPDVVAGVIPAGRCAVLRQIGNSDDLSAAANWLYGQWLPDSGQELRDFPMFAQRVSLFPDVAEHQAITDLFLPIRD
nr:GyrI-like domain-containing protein [Brevundimonas sp. G8]